MQKIQILFPDPLMARLRDVAANQDTAVSAIVRRATEDWLNTLSFVHPPEKTPQEPVIPFFDGGPCQTTADRMRQLCHDRGESSRNE